MVASTSRAPVAKVSAESPRNNPVRCSEGPAPAGASSFVAPRRYPVITRNSFLSSWRRAHRFERLTTYPR